MREDLPERVQRTLNGVRERWDPQFEVVVNDWTPWTPMHKSLTDCRVALVTSGGLYLEAGQVPFDDKHPHGDSSYREIPRSADLNELAIAHSHYDHRYARADLNVVFPLQRFRELEKEGFIGGLAETHYSFMGYVTRPLMLVVESAPQAVTKMKEENVDLAFLCPVWPICHQSVGLIQRLIELSGIPTVSLSVHPEQTRLVKPPRAAVVKNPFGAPLGEPENRERQLAIIKDALSLLQKAQEPGILVELPYAWKK